jgi:hypothetical protein
VIFHGYVSLPEVLMGKSWENIQTFKKYPEKKGAF